MTVDLMVWIGLLVISLVISTTIVSAAMTKLINLIFQERRKSKYFQNKLVAVRRTEETRKLPSIPAPDPAKVTTISLVSTRDLIAELKSRSGAFLAISVGRGSTLEKDIHCVVQAEKFELTTLFTAAQELMYRAVRDQVDGDGS